MVPSPCVGFTLGHKMAAEGGLFLPAQLRSRTSVIPPLFDVLVMKRSGAAWGPSSGECLRSPAAAGVSTVAVNAVELRQQLFSRQGDKFIVRFKGPYLVCRNFSYLLKYFPSSFWNIVPSLYNPNNIFTSVFLLMFCSSSWGSVYFLSCMLLRFFMSSNEWSRGV